MTASDLIAALALPPESRVERRVPKTLLAEHGAATAADKRQIQAVIDELQWLAALKPANVGVPAYRDETREVLEIAVLSLVLRPEARAQKRSVGFNPRRDSTARLTELVHRAIPYPVVLVAARAEAVTFSLAGKRFAQNEAGKVVFDGPVLASSLVANAAASAPLKDLLHSLALARQPRTNLLALYQGWIGCLEAFEAARFTGRFVLARTSGLAAERREALIARQRVEREIAQLRSQTAREAQINHRVELNLAIKRLEAELAEAIAHL